MYIPPTTNSLMLHLNLQVRWKILQLKRENKICRYVSSDLMHWIHVIRYRNYKTEGKSDQEALPDKHVDVADVESSGSCSPSQSSTIVFWAKTSFGITFGTAVKT
jgi:hypothetical protein